jgi:hypothetical protein
MDSRLQKLEQAISAVTSGMNAEELLRHPEGKWSTAEVLEHLYLTYTGTTRGCERCLQQDKTSARIPTLRERVKAAFVIGLGILPNGRKAPERTVPRGMPANQLSSAIGPALAAMDEAISRCEEKLGTRTMLLDHPFLGPLTPRQWRKFHWVHGRHHLKQIERLRRRA